MAAQRITRPALDRLRALCAKLPGTTLEPWYDHYRIAVGKKGFATQLNDHHGDGRVALVCKAAPGVQQLLVDMDAQTFFIPPYVGPSGWVGVRLDRKIDWPGLERLITDAYRLVAPKRALAQLDGAGRPGPPRTGKGKGHRHDAGRG